MEKKRQSNFELMRILSMLFVVMWHVILHSNLYNSTGVTKFFLEFLILFGIVHINSFIIVTGYFQSDKEFKWKKFFQTFSITWFYKAIIAIIFFIAMPGLISKGELLKELLPLDFRDYWYINCYLLLYLLSPFINKLINNLCQKDYRRLLILLFIVFSVIPFISNQGTVQNNGYTIVQFVFMYLIGGYIKKYPIDGNLHLKNYSKNKKQIIFLSIFIISFAINFILLNFSKILVSFDSNLFKEIGAYLFNNNRMYSNPLVIIQSIFYFLFFSTLTFRSKKVNYIAKYTLDVYLIHESYYILKYLYKWIRIDDVLKCKYYIVILAVLAVTFLIFSICIVIGIVRNIIFKIVNRIQLFQNIKEKIKNYISEL